MVAAMRKQFKKDLNRYNFESDDMGLGQQCKRPSKIDKDKGDTSELDLKMAASICLTPWVT